MEAFMQIDKDVVKFFKSQNFGEDFYLKKEKDWNGYELYSVCSNSDGDFGSPIFILKTSNKIRLSAYEESSRIMKFLYPE